MTHYTVISVSITDIKTIWSDNMKLNESKVRKTLNRIEQIILMEQKRDNALNDINVNGYSNYGCKNEGDKIELLKKVGKKYNPVILGIKKEIRAMGFKVSIESYDEEITIYRLAKILESIVLYR